MADLAGAPDSTALWIPDDPVWTDLLAGRGAARVLTCVLLDKPVTRAAPIAADFVAFQCPEVFVVGYGMDMAHRFRELPFVGQLVGP